MNTIKQHDDIHCLLLITLISDRRELEIMIETLHNHSSLSVVHELVGLE